jgi:hypothetical protein
MKLKALFKSNIKNTAEHFLLKNDSVTYRNIRFDLVSTRINGILSSKKIIKPNNDELLKFINDNLLINITTDNRHKLTNYRVFDIFSGSIIELNTDSGYLRRVSINASMSGFDGRSPILDISDSNTDVEVRLNKMLRKIVKYLPKHRKRIALY